MFSHINVNTSLCDILNTQIKTHNRVNPQVECHSLVTNDLCLDWGGPERDTFWY